MSSNIKAPKKLIEVALPLDDINIASAYEKLPGIGAHPRGIHHWWARRPFGAARAIIFAQMVNDPGGERGYYAGKTKKQADQEREQLFDIIRELCDWKNTNNEAVLNRAREAIRKSWRETCELNKGKPGFDPDKLPAFHDPFAGGGAIPLEAQRLGLESYASDLNPVAVMINKAMIEIPPKFAGQAPVGPIPAHEKQTNCYEDWSGAKGLAEDVRRYGHWMRKEAFKRIGHLYPQVEITAEMSKDRPDLRGLVGQKLTVIAWLWARTVKSPNPAFSHVDVPLVLGFVLSSKKGKETWIEPIVEGDNYRFEVRVGKPAKGANEGTKVGRGGHFKCLISDAPIRVDYIREQGKQGAMKQRLMTIVTEGKGGRIYLSPTEVSESIANSAIPEWKPETEINHNPRDIRTQLYGLTKYGDLFTPRQLVALTIFSDLVQESRVKIIEDAKAAGMLDDGKGIDQGGTGATAYGDAVAVYLAFAVDRSTDFNNSLTGWRHGNEKIMGLFNRQAIPMVWDFGEANIIENVVGGFITNVEYQSKCIAKVSALGIGYSIQADAANQNISTQKVISTDPPYYDNIGYADLSDFFYIWLRRSLKSVYPNLFGTLAVPKSEELVATPYRHGSKEKAEQFFMDGMTRAIHNLAENAHPAFPVTIYYAFKQSETKELGTASTGWETFLEAVIQAGFAITGTWPMRSEQSTRMIGMGTNALASSIILVCRKRDKAAETISRRQFQKELREKMPEALETMIGGIEGSTPIAPVDLAQAAIGPGMGIFSEYQAVLNQDGSLMGVHDALILINREITDYLNPDSGNFDNDTLFCSSWFDQYGWSAGPFGEADTLTRAKGTTVDGVKRSGVIESGSGKVKLMKWEDYPGDWDPKTDHRMPVWEACHHLIRALNQKGETEAGLLLARMPEKGEQIRQLAYHLYTLCERKKWAEEARAYNELITSWHGIVSASHETGHRGEQTSWLD
jgi:putative DNA methylase